MKQNDNDTRSAPSGMAAPEPLAPNKAQSDAQLSADDFHPIEIVGEPLSVTVLRERR